MSSDFENLWKLAPFWRNLSILVFTLKIGCKLILRLRCVDIEVLGPRPLESNEHFNLRIVETGSGVEAGPRSR